MSKQSQVQHETTTDLLEVCCPICSSEKVSPTSLNGLCYACQTIKSLRGFNKSTEVEGDRRPDVHFSELQYHGANYGD